jgi:hypothetical protein
MQKIPNLVQKCAFRSIFYHHIPLLTHKSRKVNWIIEVLQKDYDEQI